MFRIATFLAATLSARCFFTALILGDIILWDGPMGKLEKGPHLPAFVTGVTQVVNLLVFVEVY